MLSRANSTPDWPSKNPQGKVTLVPRVVFSRAEHRNMPMEDAVALVIRTVADIEAELTKQRAAAAALSGRKDFAPPNHHTLYLLNLLADNRFLLADELDTVIAYLMDRRDRLIEAEGGVTLKKKAAMQGGEGGFGWGLDALGPVFHMVV